MAPYFCKKNWQGGQELKVQICLPNRMLVEKFIGRERENFAHWMTRSTCFFSRELMIYRDITD